jgi:Phage tail tube protein
MAEIDGLFGGRITFNFAGQMIPVCEGTFEIDPSLIEVSADSNYDGSAAYKSKPKLVTCEITLRNIAAVDWQAIMFQSGNVTIVEEDNGRTHLFSNTRLTGSPKVDLTTGDVKGLKVEGGTYQKV